jgi:hypothetical protein
MSTKMTMVMNMDRAIIQSFNNLKYDMCIIRGDVCNDNEDDYDDEHCRHNNDDRHHDPT